MKFAGIVMLVASAYAVDVVDYADCLPTSKCATATWKCCNLIASDFTTAATAGTMICADPASTNYGIIPPTSATYKKGRYSCSKTQLLGNGAAQLAASGVAALSAAYYLY